jgi:hypothetical protein
MCFIHCVGFAALAPYLVHIKIFKTSYNNKLREYILAKKKYLIKFISIKTYENLTKVRQATMEFHFQFLCSILNSQTYIYQNNQLHKSSIVLSVNSLGSVIVVSRLIRVFYSFHVKLTDTTLLRFVEYNCLTVLYQIGILVELDRACNST